MRIPAWEGDYYERIKQRVRARGFATVTAFADSQPTASLLSLADQLGKDDVAGYHLQQMLVSEAEAKGTMERCARSLLVRNLHEELPEGWHSEWDDDSAFRRSGVYGSWCAALPDHYEQFGDQVWENIRAAALPEGWLPAGPDDPVLVEIFRKHWREPDQEKPPKE